MMRKWANVPFKDRSKVTLHSILKNGVDTWLDLADLLSVGEKTFPAKTWPVELAPLKKLLDVNKPYWQIEQNSMREVLNYPLPESILSTLKMMADDYFKKNRWVIKRWSIPHAIFMILNHCVVRRDPALLQQDVAVYHYDEHGFIDDAGTILAKINDHFTLRRDQYDGLHTGFVLEVISACQYIIRSVDIIKYEGRLALLITDHGLDNVPFHAEVHYSPEARKRCLVTIVNTFILSVPSLSW